jgi:hypothetical protein
VRVAAGVDRLHDPRYLRAVLELAVRGLTLMRIEASSLHRVHRRADRRRPFRRNLDLAVSRTAGRSGKVRRIRRTHTSRCPTTPRGACCSMPSHKLKRSRSPNQRQPGPRDAIAGLAFRHRLNVSCNGRALHHAT